MEGELADAAKCVDDMCDVRTLRAEIVYAQGLVAKAAAYEGKKKQMRVEVAPKIEDVQDEFEVLYEYTLQKESGGQSRPVHVTVRKYKLPNPHGEYQIWYDGERGKSVTVDYVKQYYRQIPVEKLSPVVAGAAVESESVKSERPVREGEGGEHTAHTLGGEQSACMRNLLSRLKEVSD
jgi:hypothetical protein